VPVVDAVLAALRSGDAVVPLKLLRSASAACTTAIGAGGPPECPPGTADGTVIEYVPYFECDGWGSADGVRGRLIDNPMENSSYPLVVLAWDPPVAAPVGDAPSMTHAVLLVRGSFGESEPASDARLLTTLAFDGDSIVEIVADCGAYSEAAFRAGALPEVPEGAEVLWRAYPAAP
jgi:hypothetical protein